MWAKRGFGLAEFLVVIVLILILAALILPKLLHGKVPANEFSAVSTIRRIQDAELKYARIYPAVGFAEAITKLEPAAPGTQPDSNHANLLDASLVCSGQTCIRSGYLFTIDQVSGTPATSFRITAVPVTLGRTGYRGFCATGLGSISADPDGGKNCSLPVNMN